MDDTEDRLVMPGRWNPPLADRPPRSMPTLWKIATYWAARDIFKVNLDKPHCFCCTTYILPGADPDPKARWNQASAYLERAHLVDRIFDGLDGPQNIVPLSPFCHRMMPSFTDGQEAIRWVQAGGWQGEPEFIEMRERYFAERPWIKRGEPAPDTRG